MSTDPSTEPTSAFEQANELWFWQGRTREARRLYEQAARAAPDDPAVQYQWARVQWAMGRGEDARAIIETLLLRSPRFASDAYEQLRELQDRLAGSVHHQLPLGIRPEDLDVDELAERRLTLSDWHALARATEQRGAYGVALFARQRAKGPMTVIEDEKEDWKLIKKAESELAQLDLLVASKG